MRYLMNTEVLPPDFVWDPRNPTGGTPEFYVRTAEETLAMSPANEVMVVYDGPFHMPDDDGRLVYLPRDLARDAIKEFDPDHILICNFDPLHTMRDFEEFSVSPIYWTNHYEDEPTPAGRGVVVSEFHRRQLADNDIFARVVPHGVDHAKYACDPVEKRKLCLFSSSFDRGGAFLEALWRHKKIRERTGYELVVTDYGRNFGAPGADKGLRSDAEMTQLYKEAQFWLHPGFGVELFCLAGAKAQAAGCTPVIVPNMALAETVRWGYRFSENEYAYRLIQVLNNGMTVTSNAEHIPSWAEATRLLWEG